MANSVCMYGPFPWLWNLPDPLFEALLSRHASLCWNELHPDLEVDGARGLRVHGAEHVVRVAAAGAQRAAGHAGEELGQHLHCHHHHHSSLSSSPSSSSSSTIYTCSLVTCLKSSSHISPLGHSVLKPRYNLRSVAGENLMRCGKTISNRYSKICN